MVILFPEVVVMVCADPPLILYVKVYGAVAAAPVKVTRGAAAFWHTAIVPATVAVGSGFTMTVAVPDCDWEHTVVLPSCTLTSEYTNVPTTLVGAAMLMLLPEVVVTN